MKPSVERRTVELSNGQWCRQPPRSDWWIAVRDALRRALVGGNREVPARTGSGSGGETKREMPLFCCVFCLFGLVLIGFVCPLLVTAVSAFDA